MHVRCSMKVPVEVFIFGTPLFEPTYAKAHRFDHAFSLFNRMIRSETMPDNFTYACVLRACSDSFDINGLRLVHCGVTVSGLGLDSICCSALVSAYSKLGLVDEASRVFHVTPQPDLVMWNSMISSYGNFVFWDKGLELFGMMRCMEVVPDGYTVVGLLSGLKDSSLISVGQGIHGLCLKCSLDYNDHVCSVLLSMYSRCRCMDSAHKVFSGLFEPDLVTWSSLITGWCRWWLKSRLMQPPQTQAQHLDAFIIVRKVHSLTSIFKATFSP